VIRGHNATVLVIRRHNTKVLVIRGKNAMVIVKTGTDEQGAGGKQTLQHGGLKRIRHLNERHCPRAMVNSEQ